MAKTSEHTQISEKYNNIKADLEKPLGEKLKVSVRVNAEEASSNIMEKKFGEMARVEVLNHAMERETGVYVRKVSVDPNNGAVTIHLPPKIVSDLNLKGKESCKWEQKGDTWTMTPLKETSIPMSIHFISSGALGLTIPEEMLFAAGLKPGDYVEWKEEEGRLSLSKATGAGESTTKVLVVSDKTVLAIPMALAMELKIEKGMFGIWTFGEDEDGKLRLWLELTHGNPNITRIGIGEEGVENQRLSTKLLPSMEGSFRKGDKAFLEVREGKLYVKPKTVK